MTGTSVGVEYLEQLQAVGLARAEHFNVALAHSGADDAMAATLLEAMDSADIGKTLATVTTLFSRSVALDSWFSTRQKLCCRCTNAGSCLGLSG